jgi:hypothetical protein
MPPTELHEYAENSIAISLPFLSGAASSDVEWLQVQIEDCLSHFCASF